MAALLFWLPTSPLAQQNAEAEPETLVVRHYQAQERYRFGLEVLDLALSKLDIPYEIVTPPNSS